MPVERFLKQVGLGLQGCRECGFDGHEQQYEVEAVQTFQTFVILAGQAFDVIAQGQHMLLQGRLGNLWIVASDILLVGREADLGVHHHLLVTRQHDQNIGLEALTVRPFEADLGLVFASLLQACVLQHPLKNQLPPIALGLLPLRARVRLVASSLKRRFSCCKRSSSLAREKRSRASA